MMKRMGRYREPEPNPDILSDEDEVEDDDAEDDDSFGPVPPPPAYPPPGGAPAGVTDNHHQQDHHYPDGDKFRDEYSDDEGGAMHYGGGSRDMESKGEDPPSDLPLQHLPSDKQETYSEEEEEEDDVDFENGDDQSLEIPPTSVVQRMVIKENVDKTERNKNLGIAAIVCCAFVVGAILLIIGFSTEMFRKTTTTSAAQATEGGDEEGAADGGRSSRVRQYLMSISQNPTAFQEADSPQNLASEYLGTDDPLELDPENPADKFQLKQKFALLAGFWYASELDWNSGAGWAFAEDECSWEGITCETIGLDGVNVTVVTEIDLSNNNLQGLSEEIGLLTHLTYLDLNGNAIEGSVPSSIVNLINLERLYLYDNLLEGEWAADLSPLKSLVELYASNNKFTDNVQKFFGITALQVLILDSNKLTGTLDGVGKLIDLERLTLGDNQIGGGVVAELGQLQNLSILWLYSNKLSGSIPAAVGNMPSLTVFDVFNNNLGDGSGLPLVFQNTSNLAILILSGNNWGGQIPDEYGEFAGPLTSLYIENAGLTGTINPNLAKQSTLRFLRLGENQFTRSYFPTFFFVMTQLVDLRLNKCLIEGDIPAGIAALENLEILYLHDNFMSGSLTASIGQLSSLRRLDLSNQFFGPDAAPDVFRSLINLEYLNLGSNEFMGAMPNIGDMESLETLTLRNNDFTGELTGGYLSNVPSLKYIDLSETKIDGVLADDWSKMENLEELRLNSIGLGGTVPKSLGDARNLRVLDLSDNAFVGLIPDMFEDLSDLTALELSRNNLVGPIPKSIGLAESLQFFRVENYDDNTDFYGLTGPLPTELGNLVNLIVFECSKNRINGNLPEEMGNMSRLTILDISSNQFTGVIPSSFAKLENLKEFFLSLNKFDDNGWSADICAINALETAVPDCNLGCDTACCTSCVNNSG